MKCQELLAALGDYVDGELDASICEKFEEHLVNCDPCEIVIDNIRQTIHLYQNGHPVEMPSELHAHLVGVLRQRWKERFPGTIT